MDKNISQRSSNSQEAYEKLWIMLKVEYIKQKQVGISP